MIWFIDNMYAFVHPDMKVFKKKILRSQHSIILQEKGVKTNNLVNWMSTVVLYCCCHSDSASVLLYFTLCATYMVEDEIDSMVL